MPWLHLKEALPVGRECAPGRLFFQEPQRLAVPHGCARKYRGIILSSRIFSWILPGSKGLPPLAGRGGKRREEKVPPPTAGKSGFEGRAAFVPRWRRYSALIVLSTAGSYSNNPAWYTRVAVRNPSRVNPANCASANHQVPTSRLATVTVPMQGSAIRQNIMMLMPCRGV